MIAITVRVPKELRDELALRAAAIDMTLPEFIREILAAAMEPPEEEPEEEEPPETSLVEQGNPDQRSLQEKIAALMARIRRDP